MAGKKKSLKLNMVLNAIKGMLRVIFPLISFPYVSKVLGVENLGKYNFATSIVSYFLLIAGLGISTYAIREGARIRENKEKFSAFANQIFTINILSTLFSYILLAILLICVPKFHNYELLIVILSVEIVFRTFGVEWIYSIFEDYAYVTLRSIIMNLLSLAMLFTFVHSAEDLNRYAIITVVANASADIISFVHSKIYCRVHLTKNFEIKKHIKPIMILFAMSLATTIYVSSDTTILGFMCDDSTVGIYSVSVKVYKIVKSILSSIVVVSIPRLSAVLGEGDHKKFEDAATDIYSTLLSVVLPAIFGMVVLRKQIILLISSNEYISAVSSLAILSVGLLFCLGAWFWGHCILIPLKKETIVFRNTVISAVINVVLNFIMIPIWQENAAAVTTLIAEGTVFVLSSFEAKKDVKLIGINKLLLKVFAGCAGIVLVSFAFKGLQSHTLLYSILVVGCSVIVYVVIETLLKNTSVTGIINGVAKKFIKKR